MVVKEAYEAYERAFAGAKNNMEQAEINNRVVARSTPSERLTWRPSQRQPEIARVRGSLRIIIMAGAEKPASTMRLSD